MTGKPSEFDLYTSATIPNALDSFSSYTYVITFSMLPMSFFGSGKLPIGTAKVGTDKIIIAQTGVTTKFNIDDLDIESVTDPYGSTNVANKSYSTKLNFNITEPLGSSLLTLLNQGFEQMKQLDSLSKDLDVSALYTYESKTKGALDLPYMIEIDLIGHRDWNDVTDKELISDEFGGQEFDNKFATYAFPFYLTQFSFDPRTEGTQYAFEGVTISNMSAKLPPEAQKVGEKAMEIEVGENDASLALTLLADKFNEYIASSTVGQSGPAKFANHQIVIQLGKMYDNDKTEGQTTWHADVINNLNPSKAKTRPLKNTDVGKDEAVGDISDDEKVISWAWTFKQGRHINDCILDILKTSNNFKNFIVDREVLANGELGEKKPVGSPQYAPVIRKSCVIDPNGRPSPTGGPAYIVTCVIDMKLQAGAKSSQGKQPTVEEMKTAVDKHGIVKQYDYMFTGINDQVMDVDISFPQGQVFLFASSDGFTPTYQDSPAVAQNQKKIKEKSEIKKDRLIDRTKAGAATVDELLNHFKQLGSDLKDAVSNLGKNTRDVIQGIKDQAKAASGTSGSVSNKDGLSRRLPSSPKAIYTKSKSILNGTKVVDSLFADLQEFQSTIEDAAEDLAGGLNVAAGQIAQIIADSANPFEFTSGLGSKLGELSSGIDGLVGNVNNLLSGTGLSLSPQDIPGLGEAQQLIDDIKKDIETFTPTGFSNSSGWQNDYEFESIDRGTDPNHTLTYLEEMDFVEASKITPYDVTRNSLSGMPLGADEDSNDTSPSDHLASVILSYSQHGVPYLVSLTLDIKGDPYWFGRDNLAKSKDKMPRIIDEDNTLKEEFNVDRTDTEHAPYGAGSVFAGFRYIFPKEYSHYDDNYSSHTGVMEITKADPSYSGYYMVVQVVHRLAGGMFTQRLTAVKTDDSPNHPIFNSKEVENAE